LFTSKALDHWAYMNRVRLDFSRPGKPTDNALFESFNAQLRRECLSQRYFSSLIDARVALDAWREEYNHRRPHGSLGPRTPAEYRAEAEAAEFPEQLALSVPGFAPASGGGATHGRPGDDVQDSQGERAVAGLGQRHETLMVVGSPRPSFLMPETSR